MRIAIDIVNPATNRTVKGVTATPNGLKLGTNVLPTPVVFAVVGD